MNCRFLSLSEKKKAEEELKEQFGISELPYLLLETGKEKIRGFSGSLSQEEILDLSECSNIEIIGLYLVRKEHDVKNPRFLVLDHSRESETKDSRSLRLSFDATQVLSQHITKNIVDTENSGQTAAQSTEFSVQRIPEESGITKGILCITEEQRGLWIRGNDLDIKAPQGIVVVRCGQDFLGCGRSTGEKITNHVPKERRLRK